MVGEGLNMLTPRLSNLSGCSDSHRSQADGVVGRSVELYLKAGMDLACFRGCPVNWYKNDCTN